MTTKHTPGPWIFGIRGDENPIEKPFDYCGPGYYDNPAIFGPNGVDVVGCDEYMIFNSEADVRLIVAAPDLLEFAQWILTFKMGGLIDARAIDVINKATGKA